MVVLYIASLIKRRILLARLGLSENYVDLRYSKNCLNSLPMALTQSNIISRFKCSGAFPFNRDIFFDLDFSPSRVTDRPDPTNSATVPSINKASTSENDKSTTDNAEAVSISNNSTLQSQRTSVVPNPNIIPIAVPSSRTYPFFSEGFYKKQNSW